MSHFQSDQVRGFISEHGDLIGIQWEILIVTQHSQILWFTMEIHGFPLGNDLITFLVTFSTWVFWVKMVVHRSKPRESLDWLKGTSWPETHDFPVIFPWKKFFFFSHQTHNFSLQRIQPGARRPGPPDRWTGEAPAERWGWFVDSYRPCSEWETHGFFTFFCMFTPRYQQIDQLGIIGRLFVDVERQ